VAQLIPVTETMMRDPLDFFVGPTAFSEVSLFLMFFSLNNFACRF
jgi:hypothetical protein